MKTIDDYLHAATRENTRQSYRAGLRHFEVEWGGLLPATADSIARYLADHAGILATSTMRQRLAALAQWHIEQGFPDPTKTPIVSKVFRGIRALHPAQPKQAKPLQLDQLELIMAQLDESVAVAQQRHDRSTELRQLRNKALLLLGFWRGFRGDELVRLRIEDIEVIPGEGMTCYLPRTKADRSNSGSSFKTPALSRLCPVEAYRAWVNATQITEGPVFRAIDRWGHVGEKPLHVDSLIPLLRAIFDDAGIVSARLYSSHSLRRGFANWASANGWDLKTLMTYVGWKHAQSAMRYIEAADPFERHRIEQGLCQEDQATRITNSTQG